MEKYLVLWGTSAFSYDDDELTEDLEVIGRTDDVTKARQMGKDQALDFIHDQAMCFADQTDENYEPLPEEDCKKARAKWIDEHITVNEQEDEIIVEVCDSSYLARCHTKVVKILD